MFLYNECNEETSMITFQKVSKHYQVDEHIVTALDDISFSLENKGFISIVGPSGCGKTTCLNLMGGLDHPTTGSIKINDIETHAFQESDWNRYRNHDVGFVFQSFYLIAHLSLLENVMLPLKLAGLSLDEQKERALSVLSSVGLDEHIHHKPNQLSGGQQQRGAIARALVHEPRLILADEPTGSLDHDSSVEVMEILKNISLDRLVVMVSHNEKLSEIYSDRIIRMDNGTISSDQKIKPGIHKEIVDYQPSPKTTKMSFITAFKLSLSNLRKRLYRTLLMVLAASIGVMGMTLVLAVSSGFDRFLEIRKTETLNAFPIRVEKLSAVVPFFDEKYQPNLPLFSSDSFVYPRNIQYEFTTINTLTSAYYSYVQELDTNLYTHMHYNFGTLHSFLSIQNDTPFEIGDTFKELPVNASYLDNHFDLLSGRLPNDNQQEMVIIVDRYNRLNKDLVQDLGFTGDDTLLFDTLLSLDIKWVPNHLLYQKNDDFYEKNDPVQFSNHADTESIDVVGILRIKDKYNLDLLQSGLYYTSSLGSIMRSDASTSDVVSDQLNSQTSVFDGKSLSNQEKENLLRDLGYSSYPIGYTIYSKNFEDKDDILRYLRDYNDLVAINYAVEPLDIAGIGLSTMRVVIDSMTIILVVFSGISLLISNLMIGIMTYTSVIERTKEIGILRAIGARKKDVGNIFYAETLMIGFLSGILGVLFTYLIMPLFDLLIEDLTTIKNVTYMPILFGLGFIIINTLITSLAGIIPARIASKKDPILCLRNE